MTTLFSLSPHWLSRLASASGFTTIAASPRDTKLLCLQRFIRLFAFGVSFLILVDFLGRKGSTDEQVGLFMTLTLLGDVIISLILTSITDKVGRRRVLAAGAGLMIVSGVVFAFSNNYWLLVIASIIGVISPNGNEIGPFRAVEESVLAQLTAKQDRSEVFAWYTLLGTAGAALGSWLCGLLVQFIEGIEGVSDNLAYQVIFLLYAACGLLKLLFTFGLSASVESEQLAEQYRQVPSEEEAADLELEDQSRLSIDSAQNDNEHHTNTKQSPSKNLPPATPSPSLLLRLRSFFPYITPQSRPILLKLLLLFTIDSLASGLASPSWQSYFFTSYHHLLPSLLGTLFLATNLLSTLSNLAALPLAKRLGPLKTMAFTHFPSAIFLALVPVPSSSTSLGTGLAMMFLALRACTQSMDQAPRQAFLSSAVLPEERTAVLGVVNMVKTLASAGGIGIAGWAFGVGLGRWDLGVSGVLKGCYDLLLLWMFVGVREREGDGS